MSYNNSSDSLQRKPRQYSISGAIATSLGINPAMPSSSSSPLDFAGRSYIHAGSFQSHMNHQSMPVIHNNTSNYEQTASLASIGVPTFENNTSNFDSLGQSSNNNSMESFHNNPYSIPINNSKKISFNPINYNTNSTTPLLSQQRDYYSEEPTNLNHDIETGLAHESLKSSDQSPSSSFLKQGILSSVRYLPAVFLGTLLNILDGLSYGMIMFPIAETIFQGLAPAGLSMFYISCIVSQLIYSCGGSAFKAGIGSEMIEVTPFFHAMAMSIVSELGGDDADKDTVIANTIFTYAISSIVTGLVFFMLGKCKLGKLVTFFPRHILVGCIGGVGYFLFVTGIEVSSRLEGGIQYNLNVLKYLFTPIVLAQWTLPLLLTILLVTIQSKVKASSVLPSYFIVIFFAFHFIIYLVPSWSLDKARDSGWVFQTVKDNQPWFQFYSLYKFELIDWWVILRQVPTMFALTFFGILHVPINVPALAIAVGMDEFDVDRELVAHGYSNLISGCIGSIQNYLVYTNSVLFIRAGADSRVAGVLLAIATVGVMIAGPVIIGYIPVCVVASLIYLLGYDLLKESLYDTFKRLNKIEYTTIVIIVFVMGSWDFVYGVFAGILLASLSFVVEAARRTSVRGMYSGEVAISTVLRHPKQQAFIKAVGEQICVTRLEGTLFFGSIGGVEERIRDRFTHAALSNNPVKYLILDMKSVVSIDFSAAEGMRRIQNLMNDRDVQMIISSVDDSTSMIKTLRDAGLWENDFHYQIQLFDDLNSALEWCENSFLSTYKKIQRKHSSPLIEPHNGHFSIPNLQPMNDPNPMSLIDGAVGSPRGAHVYKVATKSVRDEQLLTAKYSTKYNQPLPLIMITFQGLSAKDEVFWSKISQYFKKESIPQDTKFYITSVSKPTFFIVESGLVQSIFKFKKTSDLSSSILPLTAFGDLYDTTNSKEVVYTTVVDSVLWKLDESRISDLLKTREGQAIYNELLKIQIKLVGERFNTMTANLLITS